MKLNTFKTMVLGSAAILAGTALPAVAQDSMRVNVPFAFTVGGAKLPAGDYSVTQSENGMLVVTGNKASAMIMTVPADLSKSDNYSLSFTKDESPALTSVQISGAYTREVPTHVSTRKVSLVTSR